MFIQSIYWHNYICFSQQPQLLQYNRDRMVALYCSNKSQCFVHHPLTLSTLCNLCTAQKLMIFISRKTLAVIAIQPAITIIKQQTYLAEVIYLSSYIWTKQRSTWMKSKNVFIMNWWWINSRIKKNIKLQPLNAHVSTCLHGQGLTDSQWTVWLSHYHSFAFSNVIFYKVRLHVIIAPGQQ